ncbi:MAG: hypothetical protein IT385_16255 [Deltaproteobacteria bacterium]|nr:hypothetical protein [Deltaproteobacteria bacterium]
MLEKTVPRLAPPDEDSLAEVQRLERAVLAGESDVQMSVARARTGKVPVRVPLNLNVATDVAERVPGALRWTIGGLVTVDGRTSAAA